MRRGSLAIVLLLVSCGRIDFDASNGPTDATTFDATDTNNAPDAISCMFGPWSTTAQLLPEIVAQGEADPTQRADRLEIWWVEHSGGVQYEIYSARRPSVAVAFTDQRIETSLASPSSDQDPSVTSDGLSLVFFSPRTGSLRIHEATRPSAGVPFGAPTIPSGLASQAVGSLDITPDGLALYFEVGGALSIVRRATRTAPFGPAVQLGVSGVSFPSISADERELYYNGANDVMIRTRASITEPFGPPSQLVVTGMPRTEDPDISDDGLEMLIRVDSQISRLSRSCL